MAFSVCVPVVSRMRSPSTRSVASRELWCSRSVVPPCTVCAPAVVRRPRMFIWARAASASDVVSTGAVVSLCPPREVLVCREGTKRTTDP
jgi:hypothetical protein